MKKLIKNLLTCTVLAGTSLMVLSTTSCKSEDLIGFDIDLAKEVGKKLGVKVKFQEIVWEQKEIELSSKNIDLIWNGLTITEERQEAMELSIPYMENSQVIVAKKSLEAIDASTKYNIACEAGSAGADLANSDSLFANSKLTEFDSQITSLTEVLSGTSDIAIIDSVMAGYYLNDSSSYGNDLKIMDQYSFESEYYGIAGRKGDEALISKINELLVECYNENITSDISKNYGLTNTLVAPQNFTKLDTISDLTSLNYILDKGELVIGYTVFAPIAYFD